MWLAENGPEAIDYPKALALPIRVSPGYDSKLDLLDLDLQLSQWRF